MIEFINYPPQEADDVKLSSVGKRMLRSHISDGQRYAQMATSSKNRQKEEHDLSNSLYWMGQAIGHVLVESVTEPNEEFSKELASTIDEDYRENVVINPGSHTSFRVGIDQGIRVAIKFHKLEMEFTQ